MIRRSSIALRNKALFFPKENDIDIFVEDTSTSSSKFYEVLFKNILEGRIRVTRIHPCGSRKDVISAALQPPPKNRVQIFFIDSDLDLCICRNIDVDRVISWRRYCVENHLIQEDAIVKVIDINSAKATREEISKNLDWIAWKTDTERKLFDVFCRYATCHRFDLPVKTTSYIGSRLIDFESKGFLDEDKCKNRSLEVTTEALSHISAIKFLRAYFEVKRHLGCQTSIDIYISGKSYWIPLIIERIRRVFGLNLSRELVCRQLAEYADMRHIRAAVFREIEYQGMKIS